jgi:hypothetical protein
MADFGELLREEIDRAAHKAVKELLEPLEMFPSLPQISTTREMAATMRVSDDVLRQMAKDGMPHAHAGRELRFGKAVIIEWMISGKRYYCEICDEKSANRLVKTKAEVE